MDNTIFTTPEPMRWEQIAYKAYGDVNQMNALIEANTGIAADAIVPTGTKVLIPIMDDTVVEDSSLLPPWKR